MSSASGLACPECGHRQDTGERCAACSYDGVLQLDNPQHRTAPKPRFPYIEK